MTDFWKTLPLADWTKAQWESLCDGCGKCCMIRLEDEDTSVVHTTNVACKLFQRTDCKCTDYANRSKRVPDCVTLTPQNVHELYWMPDTCAYRLVAAGEDLPDYHHLVSTKRKTIHEAGMSVQDRSVCESEIKQTELEDYLVTWPGEKPRG
ncbi:MAG: YcgN family cysteine cluster protein [Robiginitomaculum sp.]|nr:YcgN family cysteine cluster protein [Robiginitomaculum sp.]